MEVKTKEEMAEEECFEYHGCFTGDCPHNQVKDCGKHFFLAGYDACMESLKKKTELHVKLCNDAMLEMSKMKQAHAINLERIQSLEAEITRLKDRYENKYLGRV